MTIDKDVKVLIKEGYCTVYIITLETIQVCTQYYVYYYVYALNMVYR